MTKRATHTASSGSHPLIEYVHAIRDRLTEAGQHPSTIGAADLDLTDLDTALRSAVDGSDAAEQAIAAAHRVVEAAQRTFDRVVSRGGNAPLSARGAALQLAGVFTAHDTASVDPSLLAAATVAQQGLADAESQHREALGKLEAAVNTADVDAVMKLRPDVEVTLPAAVDTARIGLLRARIAPARAAADLAAERAASLVAVAGQAQQRVHELEQQLEQARLDLATAAMDRTIAESAANAARREPAALAAQLAQAEAAEAGEQQRRFRRLAGLPDETNPTPRPTVDDGPASSNGRDLVGGKLVHSVVVDQGDQTEPNAHPPIRMSAVGARDPRYAGWPS